MKITIAILLFVCLLFSVGGSIYINHKVDRVVVIDVIKVFNEFELKKDLESRVEKKLNGYSEQLDSLNALVERAKTEKDSLKFRAFSKEFFVLQGEARQALEISNKNIDEQVWKRLNPLIDDFGKRGNYRLIIGANGMGSVLYKEDEVDKTQELIKFINLNYEKGS